MEEPKNIKEKLRRAVIAMKSTWSIGERIFKEFTYFRSIKNMIEKQY